MNAQNIVVCTSIDSYNESRKLKDFLLKSGIPFFEQDVDSHPDFLAHLITKFGGQVSIPGILCGDNEWVAADAEDLYDAISRFKGDVIPDVKQHVIEALDREREVVDDRFANPNIMYTAYSSVPESTPSTNSFSTWTSFTSGVFPEIKLPNGQEMAVSDLLRVLMRATKHHILEKDGNSYYYVRGYEAMEVLANLFFHHHGEADLIAFGGMLIDRGIMNNYTPNCSQFQNSFLVLQPLKEPSVLNTFVKWPMASSTCKEDPMDVIIRLSRLMDLICSNEDYKDHPDKFNEFELASCQLQGINFPQEPLENVTFALNLFNLIIRHAMIISESRDWTWPQSLEEFVHFIHKISYNVGGKLVTLAELQSSLYGRSSTDLPRILRRKPSIWDRLVCRTVPHVDGNVWFDSPLILTDPRILVACTWGTRSSSEAQTIYPNRLDECLQTAAELFCQKHVIVRNNKVILPALLAWYRNDLGGNAVRALDEILPYLSFEQLQMIDYCNHPVVMFDFQFDWEPGIPLKDDRPEEAAPPRIIPSSHDVKTLSSTGSYYDDNMAPHAHVLQLVRGNQPSVGGDIQLFPPKRPDTPVRNEVVDDGSCEFYDEINCDGRSLFHSDMSALTFESDFDEVILFRSRRRLQL